MRLSFAILVALPHTLPGTAELSRLINHEVFNMNLLQRLFDRLIGVAQYEAALRDNAHRIFSAPCIDASAFEKPACWRRAGRVQRHCQTE